MSFSSFKDHRKKKRWSPAEILGPNNITLYNCLKQKPVQKLIYESKTASTALCVLPQSGQFCFLQTVFFGSFLSLSFLYFWVVCNFYQRTSDQASEKEMKYSTDDETAHHVWSKGCAEMLPGLWWISQLHWTRLSQMQKDMDRKCLNYIYVLTHTF